MPYRYHCTEHGERQHKDIWTDGRRYCCDVCRNPVRLEFERDALPRVEVETPIQRAEQRAGRAEADNAYLRSILADFAHSFEEACNGDDWGGKDMVNAYRRAVRALRNTGGSKS